MEKTKKGANCCAVDQEEVACCHVESILSVDERGQMVLPKDVRERAQIRTGDKLALVSWEKQGQICCFALIRVEELAGMVKEVLGPLMGGVIR